MDRIGLGLCVLPGVITIPHECAFGNGIEMIAVGPLYSLLPMYNHPARS